MYLVALNCIWMFVSKICSSGWRLSPFTSLSPFLPDVSLSSLPELLPSCNARRVSGCDRRQAGGHHNGSRSRRLLRIIDSAKFVMEKDRTRDHDHGARAFLGRRCLLQLVLNGSSRYTCPFSKQRYFDPTNRVYSAALLLCWHPS